MVKDAKTRAHSEPCEALGQTWWLANVTPGHRKMFSSLVRSRARQSLIDDKPYMDAKDYRAQWKDLQARIDAGAYDWGPPVELGGMGYGEAIQAALDTTEGNVRLVQMLLEDEHGEVPLSQVAEILNANPEGITAAIRAGMGLPPFSGQPETAAAAEPTAAKNASSIPTTS